MSSIGEDAARVDGPAKVTGAAQYTGDLEFPGLTFVKTLRTVHPHARLTSVDASAAEALPGVVAVLTRADLVEGNSHFGPVVKDQPIVALDRVRYAGEVVVAVAAEEPGIAEEAVDLIRVEFEPLTPVVDPVEAMAPGAPILHETRVRSESRLDAAHYRYEDRGNVLTSYSVGRGDPEEGFAASDLVFEDTYTTPKIQHGHLEPHVVTAFWDAAGKLTVYSATQNPSSIRVQLAELFELPQSMVRVVVPYVGGGYGGKVHLRLEPLAAALARKAGRPVQWKLTREEVFLTGHCHASVVRIKTGVNRDGTIVAREVEAVYDTGAYALTGPSTSRNGGEVSGGPYRIPHQRLTSYCVYTNTPPTGPYRGFGVPQVCWAYEAQMDDMARRLELDPLEFRLQNAAEEGTVRADGAAFGVIGNVDTLKAVQESEHYRSELSGENRGRGVASGFWFNVGFTSAAHASVQSDGSVALILGSADIGGTRASLAMQFAETLGIPYESVNPQVVSTDAVGYTMVTGGSRTAFAGGWAAHEAALDIRRQLEERAAAIWECDLEAVSYEDGVLSGPDDQSFTFKEICEQLPHTGGLIQGKADVSPETSGPAFACHVVDVEVDPETGKVDILRYTAAQDVGTAVHPSYVESQIQGGVAQGIGMALHEEYVFDDGGNMENPTLLDYRMPTTFDLPMLDTILVEVENPGHPYGVRGVGEIPIVPPLAAVANAIHDAMGVRVQRLPATPDRLLQQLEEEAGQG